MLYLNKCVLRNGLFAVISHCFVRIARTNGQERRKITARVKSVGLVKRRIAALQKLITHIEKIVTIFCALWTMKNDKLLDEPRRGDYDEQMFTVGKHLH